MDYSLMVKTEEQTQPILVTKDRDSEAVCSFLVLRKGNEGEYVVKRFFAFLHELGIHHRRWSSSRNQSRHSDL